MVAHASASQNVAPPGHSPSHGSSPASGAMDEKETEEKPASKHICSNTAHERAWEKTSIELDSPTMVACPLNAESRPPRCARGAPTAGTPTSFPSAASAPSPITAGPPCASKSPTANTPCATQSLPPGRQHPGEFGQRDGQRPRKVQNAVDIDQVERCIFYAGLGKVFGDRKRKTKVTLPGRTSPMILRRRSTGGSNIIRIGVHADDVA